jgi:hypothetical protein
MSAYRRHLYNKETPCDACKQANRARVHLSLNPYEVEMAKELERNPPIIQWVKNRRGVLVAAQIHDPHTDHPNRNPTKRKTA